MTLFIRVLQHSIRVVIYINGFMEEIVVLIISTLLAWAVERSADAVLDLITEWLKRRF